MNGTESQNELDRCWVWDSVFKYGPMNSVELKKLADDEEYEITRPKIETLVEHEWFILQFGMVYIAKIDGCRRRVPKVA